MKFEKIFRKKEILFIAKFFIVFLVLQALIIVLPLAPVKIFIAETAGFATGFPAIENKIIVSEQAFEITENCTGLVSGAILAALVFSLRRPELKKKFLIAITGALILFLLNFPRILFVLYASQAFGIEYAELFHEITWYSTALLVFLAWFFGMKKIGKIKNFGEMI